MSFDGSATSINTVHRTGRSRLSVDGRGQETPQPARSPFAARRNCTMRLCGLRTRGRWSCGGPTNREHTGLQVSSRSSGRSVRVGVTSIRGRPVVGVVLALSSMTARRGEASRMLLPRDRPPCIIRRHSVRRLGHQHPGYTSGGRYVGSTDFEICPWCARRPLRAVSRRDVCLCRPASAQLFQWTPEQLIKYTAKNPYQSFPRRPAESARRDARSD